MKWVLIALVLLSARVEAASIHFKTSSFLQNIVQEALKTLPEGYLGSLDKDILIQEEALKSDLLFQTEDLCHIDEGVKFGRTYKNMISISARLVELSKNNEKIFKCGHGSFKNMLKAVVIHELTHVKDNAERISIDEDFQRIVGIKKVQKNSKKKVLNQNLKSSPDPYEFENLEEALAVNVEYLVLDPEFECRKPRTANYLSKKLGIPLKGECSKNHKVLVQSAFPEDHYQTAVSIDPKRIYQIHYLFAGKGEGIMSRWGHAMFRIVLCAPFRKAPGPDCLNDVSHHLALSYRAYMNDINLSYAKGLFGGYPSQLFIFHYLEVQQEYTKFELRDLFSVPLKMTEDQKKEFLDLTLERYWTYQGKYYFLDNNCGTETAKHLAVVLSEEESKLVGSITPLKIYKDIVKQSNDLADANLEGLSREEMISRGFLVPSMFEGLNDSYQSLRAYLPSFSYRSMKTFLKKTNASIRYRDYQTFIQNSQALDLSLRKQVAMKLVHFERYLANRFLMELPKKAMEKMDKDQEMRTQVLKMGEGLMLLNIQPWSVVHSRYGTPVSEEFETMYPSFQEKRQSGINLTIESQMSNLQGILGSKHFENELNEIEELKKIKKLTSDFINEINNVH